MQGEFLQASGRMLSVLKLVMEMSVIAKLNMCDSIVDNRRWLLQTLLKSEVETVVLKVPYLKILVLWNKLTIIV